MKQNPEIKNFSWDAIVVGSGIGSSTAAHELIHAGKKVLILEKGNKDSKNMELPLWNESVIDLSAKKTFKPFLGEGAGGSSRIFGMVMERLEESDFQLHQGRWPTSLQDWNPYYSKAEKIYNVTPALTPKHFDPLLKHLNSIDVNPHSLKLSYKAIPDCNFCQSKLCEKSCKIDAWSGPLEKILNHPNLSIIYGARVTRIIADNIKASAVEVVVGNETITLSAKNVFLGLGAIRTPYLLRNSSSPFHPYGIGNSKDLLGRFLMRHYVDLYFLKWKDSNLVKDHKSIGINDFYKEVGMFQSFGSLPPFNYVLDEILADAQWLKKIPGVSFVLTTIVKKIFSTHVMASIVEDSPSFFNRLVFETDDVIRFEYKVSDKDRKKILKSREIAKKIFHPMLTRVQYEAENNKRLAHVCGTCVMGESIEDSVVDYHGRIHELENLYVVDSSVFPSSSGKNPSLTIAAHAIRCVEESLRKDKA